MPGGTEKAWPYVKDMFQAIAAKTDDSKACCRWIGEGGSGHFVKMVHNGIEYGDMQIICEAYHFMKAYLEMNNEALAETFEKWNQTELNSYLIEITADIFRFKDDKGDVIDRILDAAGQKGTGKWTGINALDFGVPLTLIVESVFARCISAKKEIRIDAEKLYGERTATFDGDKTQILNDLQQALLFAKIISYAQGYMLMQEASKVYQWALNYGDIALIWREGCIIRSVFLERIKQAFDKKPSLENLLFDEYFKNLIQKTLPSVRKVAAQAIENGIPMPAITSAIGFFDSFKSAQLPANLLQAQRDYFGAHSYEAIDAPRGKFFHTDWIGSNSKVSSSSYNV